MENKSKFNSYEIDKKLDKLHEVRRTYKGMEIYKALVEESIVRKIHRYGMISGVSL